MKCLSKKLEDRYQKASDIIRNLAKFKGEDAKKSDIDDIWGRIRAREVKSDKQCWNCRRPLHHKTTQCYHCGEIN